MLRHTYTTNMLTNGAMPKDVLHKGKNKGKQYSDHNMKAYKP